MPTISECNKELRKLKKKDVCIDSIKEILKDCLSKIQNKLKGYSGQCLSQEEIELREATKAEIDNININTEKDQLDTIKALADRFDLTKKFKERYGVLQKQIREDINNIDLSINVTTLTTLDTQAENYDLGKNIATTQYNEVKKDAEKQQIHSKINTLNKDTTKEVIDNVKQEANTYGLIEEYNNKVSSINRAIIAKINSLKPNTEKVATDSIRMSAINYNLKDIFDQKLYQIKNQLQVKIDNIKIADSIDYIVTLDKQAENYGLGKNAATTKLQDVNLQEAIHKIKTETGYLYIDLYNQTIKDSEVVKLGKVIAISKLTSLKLYLHYNQITNIDALGKGLADNTKLTSLTLNLKGNQIKNVDELGKAITINKKLISLKLYFYNNQIGNIDVLGHAIAINSKITSLELFLGKNQIVNVDALGKGIATNTGLTSLVLSLGREIGNKKVLRVFERLIISPYLSIYRNFNNKITNVDEMGRGIAANIKLTSLTLDLDYHQIKNVDELGKGIAVNTKLTSLELYLHYNQIKNVDELGKAVAVNTKLTSLVLDLSSNQITDIDELCKGVAVNTKLALLKLDLSGNKMTNEGAKILSDAINKSAAQITLNYDNNDISEEGKKVLENALSLNADPKHREKQKSEKHTQTKIKNIDLDTEKHNQAKKIAIENSINNLTDKTTKEDRHVLKQEAADNSLTKVFKDKIDDIKKDIKQEIVNLTISTEKTKISSIKISAINYDLGKEFSDKFNQVANQIKLNLENIKPDTLKKNIDSLDIQASNYDLGNNIATKKQVVTKINALSKSTPKAERQGLEQKSKENNLINEFTAKVNGIKEEIKTDIASLKTDTEKTKIDSVKTSATNYDLGTEFDEKFNEIQNQLQTKINNINTTYSKSNITILDKQAENYSLGKNAATAKFNEIKDDKYLKFIELQDNTAVKTIFKSEECFKVFDSQNIQICLKGMDKRVIANEKLDQCNDEYDCISQNYWWIKKDYYIKDSNNFLKICLDEFAAEQFVPCNNYDGKKAISGNIQNLDIKIQYTAIFTSEKCFSIFALENIETCLRGTKIHILPKSAIDQCNNPDECMLCPSWSISTEKNLLSFEDYLQICKEEFENKNFISCDDQFSSWLDLSLIMKLGFTTIFLIGMMYMCKDRLPFLAGAGQLPLEEQRLIGTEGMQDHDNTAFIEH